MKKHILHYLLGSSLLIVSYINCAQKPLRKGDISFLIKAQLADVSGDVLWKTLSMYVARNGLENVQKAVEGSQNLKDLLTPTGQTYAWKDVAGKLEDMKKSAGGGVSAEEMQKKIDIEVGRKVGDALKANEKFQKEYTEAVKKGKDAQKALLRTVLTADESAGLKSVQQYRPEGQKESKKLDSQWVSDIDTALAHQFNPSK